jgi:adenosylcobinamide kinase/adenosylcobinamide-phosphate guanylyltransferase
MYLVLYTGGSRSGKSAAALARGEGLPGPRLYVATAQVSDPEMAERIARHRSERAPDAWQTIEEPLALSEAIAPFLDAHPSGGVLLIDCLSFWASNMLLAGWDESAPVNESLAADAFQNLQALLRPWPGQVLLVTNEVGLGVVPPSALGRAYRDVLGRCNQAAAAAADEVIFMVSGLPWRLKPAGC